MRRQFTARLDQPFSDAFLNGVGQAFVFHAQAVGEAITQD
jgi:hypothetical protein